MFNLRHYIITKDITFFEIIDSWLTYKYNSVKESTYFKYKYVIEKYLYPKLKQKTIKELLKCDFNNLVCSFNNLDKTTVKMIITVLKSVLHFAERKYDVDFKTDLIKFPKNTKKNLQIFKDLEKQRLVNYCYNDNSLKSIGILMSLYTPSSPVKFVIS